MHCPSCGANLPPSADFCPYCGTQIGGPEPQAADTGPAGAQPWGSASDDSQSARVEDPPPQDASLEEEPAPRRWRRGKIKSAKKAQPRLSIKEPPKPEMPLWKKAGLCIVSFAVVATLALWGLHLYHSADAVRAVTAHLDTVRKQRWANAYSQTSSSFQRTTTESDFRLLVRSERALGLLLYYSVDSRNLDGDRATIKLTLTDRSGQDTPVAYDLIKESGGWKISAIRLDERADETPEPLAISDQTTETPTERSEPETQTETTDQNEPSKAPGDDRGDSGKVKTQ